MALIFIKLFKTLEREGEESVGAHRPPSLSKVSNNEFGEPPYQIVHVWNQEVNKHKIKKVYLSYIFLNVVVPSKIGDLGLRKYI